MLRPAAISLLAVLSIAAVASELSTLLGTWRRPGAWRVAALVLLAVAGFILVSRSLRHF